MTAINHLFKLITTLLMVFSSQLAFASSKIDVDESKIEWLATKVTGQHKGTITLLSGELDYSDQNIKSAIFVMDMTSIVNLDIEGEQWRTKLMNHLKSKDFFDVPKHPTAVFELSSAVPIKGAKKGEANFHFVGDLLIKGITHSVEFNAWVDLKPSAAHARGQIIVDRTKYGIKYGSNKFFFNLGDKAIDDNFIITFDLLTL